MLEGGCLGRGAVRFSHCVVIFFSLKEPPLPDPSPRPHPTLQHSPEAARIGPKRTEFGRFASSLKGGLSGGGGVVREKANHYPSACAPTALGSPSSVRPRSHYTDLLFCHPENTKEGGGSKGGGGQSLTRRHPRKTVSDPLTSVRFEPPPYMREIGTMWQIGVLTGKPCTFLVQNGSFSAFWHYKNKERVSGGLDVKWHISSTSLDASIK